MASVPTGQRHLEEEEETFSIEDSDSDKVDPEKTPKTVIYSSSLVFSLDPLSIPSGLHLWLHTDTLSAPSATVLSEAQLSDPFAPEPVSSATSSETSAPSGTSATLAAVTTEVDLFGDAFAASPGETPAAPEGAAAPATPVPVAAALDACSGNDPFAPSEGSAETASELDLFAMKPTETSVPVVTPTTSTASPALATTPSPPPPPFPAAATTATTTTTTTATTSASTTTSTTTAPALDIFGDLFDSVSEVPTAPKSDTAPHVDLLDSDAFSSASHGVSPLAESSLTADLLSDDTFAAPPPVPTASPAKVDSSAVIDLFGDAFGGCTTEPQSTAQAVSSSSASADLLAGFGGSFMAPSAAPITPAQNNVLQTNFYADFGATPSTGGSSFDPSGFDGLGDLLMPMVPAAQSSGSPISMSMNASGSSKVLGGDLDSSLANLVGSHLPVGKPSPNYQAASFSLEKENCKIIGKTIARPADPSDLKRHSETEEHEGSRWRPKAPIISTSKRKSSCRWQSPFEVPTLTRNPRTTDRSRQDSTIVWKQFLSLRPDLPKRNIRYGVLQPDVMLIVRTGDLERFLNAMVVTSMDTESHLLVHRSPSHTRTGYHREGIPDGTCTPALLQDQAQLLCAYIIAEEIEQAIDGMATMKAPRGNGLPIEV
ncbi:clathrin coat assembly protein AP180-like [Pleurodeles waltl]|uniref:clathrin coat assembly protein AP180-like n=1 Tax=Pleurodeles waltl TaxID=8319 RepID=UPI0037099222